MSDSPVAERPADSSSAPRVEAAVVARRDRLIATLLFAIAWLVCWQGPVEYHYDSKYTLLLTQNLLSGGGLALDRYFEREAGDALTTEALPYQVKRLGDHVYLAYPNASAFLAVPLVAALNGLGLSPLDAEGRYDPRAEIRMQRLIVCPLVAGLTALLFLGFRTLAPVGLSVAAALTASLGSVVLSDLSRALWAQTWAALGVGAVCWQLLKDRDEPGAMRPPVVGSALALLVLVRPPAMLIVLCVLGYLLAERRGAVRRVTSWMAIWWLLAAGLNLAAYGSLRQPSHYEVAELFSHQDVLWRTWQVLTSPSRGLVVFMPWVLLLALAPLVWRRLCARALVATALAAALGHLALLGLYTQWIGGACYGPRLWAELVPLLAMASLVTLVAALESWRGVARSLLVLFALAASGWSLFVNVRGAYSWETKRWNRLIRTRELRLRYASDWSRPQFLEGLASADRAGSENSRGDEVASPD